MSLPLPVENEHGWAAKLNAAIGAKADLIDGTLDLDQLPDYLGQLVLDATYAPIGESYYSQSKYGINGNGTGDQATGIDTLFTDSAADSIPSLVFGNVNTDTSLTVTKDVMLKGLPGATLTINDGGVGYTICPAAEVVATAPNAAAVGATVLTFPGENWLVDEHVGKWIEVTDPVIAASGNMTVHPRRVVSNTADTVTLEYGIGYAIPASPTASGPVTTSFFTPLNRVWIEDVTLNRATLGNGGSIVIKYVKDVRLNRFKVHNSGNYGSIKGNAVAIYSCDKVRSWGGEVVNAGNFGFFCYNSDDVQIYGQRVKGFAGQFGMQLKDCRDATAVGCRVYGDGVGGDTGFNIKCSGLNPARNITLHGCTETASRVNGYELSSITTEGSGFVAEDFKIVDCVSDGSAGNGFTTITDATSLPLIRGWAWIDNRALRATNFGYLAPIAGMEIRDNVARLNGFEGMSISATDVVVKGGAMIDNSQVYVSGATRSSEILLNATAARTSLEGVRFVRTSAGKTIRAVREIAGASATVISFPVIYHPATTGYSQDYLLSGANSRVYGDTAVDYFAGTVPTINKISTRDAGLVCDPSGTAAANAAKVAADAITAASQGIPLLIRGSFSISDDIALPSGSVVDISGATITQTTDLTCAFTIADGVDNVRIFGGTLIGKTSDYVNTSGVYQATAVRVLTGSSNVTVSGVTMLGWAGAGVEIQSGTTGQMLVENCTMTGAGFAYLLDTSYGSSGGVRVLTRDARVVVRNNDVSGFGQGFICAEGTVDMVVTGNCFHDNSQHGGYTQTAIGMIFTYNTLKNNRLCGMKQTVEQGNDGFDGTDILISGNIVEGNGAQGILTTNPSIDDAGFPLAAAARLRRIRITNNIISSTQHAIECNPGGIDLTIEGNLINGVQDAPAWVASTAYTVGQLVTNSGHVYKCVTAGTSASTGGPTGTSGTMTDGTAQWTYFTVTGIEVDRCTNVDMLNNSVTGTPDQAITLSDVTTFRVIGNQVTDCCTSNNAATEYAVHLTGACTNGVIEHNRITDAGGNMRYGIYANLTSGQDTLTVRFNYSTGASDYGIRFPSAQPIGEFHDNAVSGGSGTVLNKPTTGRGHLGSDNFGSAAPVTGTWAVGDRFWNTAPAASGSIGWVCTTAGTPGTWKAFGTIAA